MALMSNRSPKPTARTTFALLALAGCAVFLLACGSDQSEPEVLNKSQFTKRANAVCEEGLKEKERVLQAGFERLQAQGESSSKAGGEELVGELVPVLRGVVRRLQDLPAPPEDQVAVRRILVKFETGLKKAEEDPGSVVERNPFVPANRSARAYGLESCSF